MEPPGFNRAPVLSTSRRCVARLLMVAAGVLALFQWQARYGLGLAEEGFLWYRAQRVLLGVAPVEGVAGRHAPSGCWPGLRCPSG
jgi:hypothetical protein